jgi:hypothetical protein
MPHALKLSVGMNDENVAVIGVPPGQRASVFITHTNPKIGESTAGEEATIDTIGSLSGGIDLCTYAKWIDRTDLASGDEICLRVVEDEPATPPVKKWTAVPRRGTEGRPKREWKAGLPGVRKLSVAINGTKTAVIQAGPGGNASVIINHRNVEDGDPRPDDGITIEAGGVFSPREGVLVFAKWIEETHLALGDEVRIRVVEDEPATPPLREWTETPPRAKQVEADEG